LRRPGEIWRETAIDEADAATGQREDVSASATLPRLTLARLASPVGEGVMAKRLPLVMLARPTPPIGLGGGGEGRTTRAL